MQNSQYYNVLCHYTRQNTMLNQPASKIGIMHPMAGRSFHSLLAHASKGRYFITICTKNREYYFGEIIDIKMILSEIGKIAHKYWQEIPNHFSFAQLDKFVIMPNHNGIFIDFRDWWYYSLCGKELKV